QKILDKMKQYAVETIQKRSEILSSSERILYFKILRCIYGFLIFVLCATEAGLLILLIPVLGGPTSLPWPFNDMSDAPKIPSGESILAIIVILILLLIIIGLVKMMVDILHYIRDISRRR
ncbi:MAG: hypothetical protein V1709_10700, partial [Planctomycetota bacterium]